MYDNRLQFFLFAVQAVMLFLRTQVPFDGEGEVTWIPISRDNKRNQRAGDVPFTAVSLFCNATGAYVKTSY